MTRQNMHLVGHLLMGPTLHHVGGWRHPESDVDLVLDPERYENLARLYERGMFDGVLIVDSLNVPGLGPDTPSKQLEYGVLMMMLDPMLVLAQMARVTEHLGLTATMSTLVHAPYHIARSMASLDHLSHGRAGWNIVTSASPSVVNNYGLSHLPSTQERYDHADEVVEACMALWETWDDGALVIDRTSGKFADPTKVHYVEYEGEQVTVRGGLVTPRSPQGRPVFFQAGGSPRGRQFAARWAEGIFTIQKDQAALRSLYDDIKGDMDAYGRPPDDCAVLVAAEVFVDNTESLAQEWADSVDSLADDRAGLVNLSVGMFARDVSEDPLDTPISQVPLPPGGPRVQGPYENMLRVKIDGREPTLGEMAHLQATTHLSPRFIGTPESVADQMQEQFESGCCDGYILTHAVSPHSLQRFVDLVVPELQRRGVLRKEYTGRTFRENLQG